MDKKISLIKERVLYISEYKGINRELFFEELGLSYANFKGRQKKTALNSDAIDKILSIHSEISTEWLVQGKGAMLKTEDLSEKTEKNLIPLYDDVATIGGKTEMIAETEDVCRATEYIDAGDWFKDVTAAIRHYGDSMQEYPNGCILALRKITDIRGIVWGRNYVIETNEIRVTKRMQTCPDDEACIMAYSTNTETYPDGRLVHEPFKIYKEDIRRIFLVIGRVVKEYSSDPVYTIQK